MSSITPTNFRGSRKHFVSTLLVDVMDEGASSREHCFQ